MENLITPSRTTVDWGHSINYNQGVLNIKQFHEVIHVWSKLFKHIPIDCLKIIAYMAGYVHVMDALSVGDGPMMLFMVPPSQTSTSMVGIILFKCMYQPLPFLEWILTHYPRTYGEIRQYQSGNSILGNIVNDLPRLELVCHHLQMTNHEMMKFVTNLWFIDDYKVWFQVMKFARHNYDLTFTSESELLPNLIYDSLCVGSLDRLKYIRETWNISSHPDLIENIEELVRTQSESRTPWEIFYTVFG